MPIPTQINDETRPRLAPGVRLQIEGTTGKAVLLYPEGIIELNETAQAILTRCDGAPLGQIISALTDEYEIDREALIADVRETITDLQRRNLLE